MSTASIASAVEELDGAIHTLSSHTEHVVTQAHSAETLADQAQSQLDSAAARMGAFGSTACTMQSASRNIALEMPVPAPMSATTARCGSQPPARRCATSAAG